MTPIRAAYHFRIEGDIVSCTPYGNGHINETFLVRSTVSDYILQRINKNVFKRPDLLMENIVGVTEHLKKKIKMAGGDTDRECLNVIPTTDSKAYYMDEDEEYWRIYLFVKDSLSLERVENAGEFYESGYAFGRFASMLSDYPAETLHIAIPDFHNTPKRYENFIRACEKNKAGRLSEVSEEVAFVRKREDFVSYFTERIKNGSLKLSVTHNDTKLNNVLFDKETKTGLCVIDLDTIMPGLPAYDFGDSIRFGASTAAEDERDLSKVHFDIQLFKLYAEGYLKGVGSAMTQAERNALPYGAIMMTLECGMRFLTDYLEGDIYFRTHRENQNLDRCRTQFRLVQEMEQKLEDMKNIIQEVKKA